jgi:hypothetical protein
MAIPQDFGGLPLFLWERGPARAIVAYSAQ